MLDYAFLTRVKQLSIFRLLEETIKVAERKSHCKKESRKMAYRRTEFLSV